MTCDFKINFYKLIIYLLYNILLDTPGCDSIIFIYLP